MVLWTINSLTEIKMWLLETSVLNHPYHSTLHRISFSLQIVLKSPKSGVYWLGSVEYCSQQNSVFVEFLLGGDCHLQRWQCRKSDSYTIQGWIPRGQGSVWQTHSIRCSPDMGIHDGGQWNSLSWNMKIAFWEAPVSLYYECSSWNFRDEELNLRHLRVRGPSVSLA